MEIFVYRQSETEIKENFSAADLPALLRDESNLVWVDFEAPTVADERILADVFKFHYLTIEDARETRNHPKVEEFSEYLFFVVQGVKSESNSFNFVTKELDGYLGKNFVVTFHHENFRSIDAVKQQIRATPYPCSRGADYLLHQILDRIVDLYIPVVDDFDNAISNLEERIFRMKKSDTQVLEDIMDLRRNVNRLIRISSKQLNVLYRISHGEFPQIHENILPFYRDVYDHLQRVSDLAENYRDLVGGLLDIHFSIISNKTNDIIKFLTIFSAIILPLSLIAGIYGMNFENMPELHTRNGYFYTLGAMFLVAVGLLIYFWRKGWIFEGDDNEKK